MQVHKVGYTFKTGFEEVTQDAYADSACPTDSVRVLAIWLLEDRRCKLTVL